MTAPLNSQLSTNVKQSNFCYLPLSSSKTFDVIYKISSKIGPKNAFFQLDFFSFFASKPLHIVVVLTYLPFNALFVIRIILSTCLEDIKKMLFEPSGCLTAG